MVHCIENGNGIVFVHKACSFPKVRPVQVQLLPWIFALDHFLYARWLSVHVSDIDILAETNPDVYVEFEENDNFVVAGTINKFSPMDIDQRHKQLNADVKGAGGAIGLTEDDNKLLRWMECGPEEARMVREFEKSCLLNDNSNDTYRHHEYSKSFEMMFSNDVENLEREFIQVGNPFQTETSELINLVINDVMDETVVNLFNEPIKKNNLHLLSRTQNKKGGKNKNQEIK